MNYLSKYGTRCEVIKLLLKKYDWLHVTWLFFLEISLIFEGKHPFLYHPATETESSSGWLLWSSLRTLKRLAFNVSTDD